MLNADERNRRFEELIAYLDGACSADEADRVERALAASAEYRSELEDVRSMYAGLESLGECIEAAVPTIDIADAVLAAVDQTATADSYFESALDYLDGNLSSDALANFEWMIDAAPECESELQNARNIYASLEAIGNRVEMAAPSIDLIEGVMAAIQPKVISIETRRANSPRAWVRWGGLAAAAGIAIVAGLAVFNGMRGGVSGNETETGANGPLVADGSVQQRAPLNPEAPDATNPDGKPDSMIAKQRQKLDSFMEDLKPTTGEFQSTEDPALGAPKLNDILTARRDKGSGGEGLSRLRQWASLKEEAARSIVSTGTSSPEAIVAAAQALKGQEKQQALLTAVGMMPQQPFARFELAKALTESDDSAAAPTGADVAVPVPMQAQAKQELSSLKQLDQNNALPYYLEAKLLLEQGDVAGALQALEIAQQFDTASAYSLEAAAANEQALLASGMDPESAKLVAALTGGMDEFNFLCDLGQDLLSYGSQFEQAGDVQTAQQLYEAVQQLGVQLENGADFGQERLAGLDLQTAAIDVLENLLTTFESVEGLEALTTQTIDLVGQIDELTSFFAAFDQLLFGHSDSEFWNMVSGFILQTGDVNVFDYLNQLGLPLDVPQGAL